MHVNQRFKISIAVAYRREDAFAQLCLPGIPVKRRISLSLFVLVRQFFHRDPYGFDSVEPTNKFPIDFVLLL